MKTTNLEYQYMSIRKEFFSAKQPKARLEASQRTLLSYPVAFLCC